MIVVGGIRFGFFTPTESAGAAVAYALIIGVLVYRELRLPVPLAAVLLVLGTFMESIAIILILAPVFVPMMAHYGIDPVWFGVLLTLNLAIGANTPPLGIDLMAACRVGRIPMSASFDYLVPFLGVMVLTMLAVLFFPGILFLN